MIQYKYVEGGQLGVGQEYFRAYLLDPAVQTNKTLEQK